jgi:hypothetical protein
VPYCNQCEHGGEGCARYCFILRELEKEGIESTGQSGWTADDDEEDTWTRGAE